MRVLILANGEAERWGNHLGVPKHLIPFKGEPLIHRTQRMLAERGVDDVRVVCRDERVATYVRPPAMQGKPEAIPRAWVHEAEESRYLWSTEGRTMILYGDIYYSNDVMDRMVNDPAEEWHVYGRHDGSQHTGKPYGEMFGWVFRPHDHKVLDAARNVAIAYTENGLWWRCIGWEVYRIATKQLPWHHSNDDVHFMDHDDVTDDFDSPNDLDVWVGLNPTLI